MAGIKFGEDDMTPKKKATKRGKSDGHGTMHFKKVEVSLYNGPDAHIKERRSRKAS